MRPTAAAPLLLAVMVLTACEEPPQREDLNYASPAAVGSPLELDPTEDIKIGRWWTNGQELLRLDADHRFAIYGSLNRYHLPRERGRWDQVSYAVIRLDPYSLLPQESVRVKIAKINGEVTLVIPELEPFFAIEQPPAVTEDALFGTWYGPLGALRLQSSMRYSFSPDTMTGAAIASAGHKGTWRLEKRRVILTPDVVGMGPFELELLTGENQLQLTTPEGGFEHESVAAPSN